MRDLHFAFRPAEIEPAFLTQGIDEAFAEFAAECLRSSYDSLHLFPTGGKDGAIDFASLLPNGRVVGDFKYSAEPDAESVRKSWRTVADRLRRNLGSTSPVKGQAQYAPWYDRQS